MTMASQQATNTNGSQAAGTHKVLTFELGRETYGVEILRVREIRGWTLVAKIPHAPSHVLGVLNLRGSIVPVVDLRLRFELERAEYTQVTVIIVLSVHSNSGRREVGVVVDGVSDVVDFDASAMKPAPDLGPGYSSDYICGLVPVGERMVVLLDIDRLIGIQLSGPAADPADPTLEAA
jgi:purine-binding chemotaxis protein CheW